MPTIPASRAVLIVLAIGAAGCAPSAQATPPGPQPATAPVTEVVSASGVRRQVWIAPATEAELEERGEGERAQVTLFGNEHFTGKVRAAVKTSISTGAGTVYTNGCGFLTAKVPLTAATQDSIRARGGDTRAPQEDFNARFDAYSQGVSRPADNDYHVIVSDSAGPPYGCLVNIEVSGLPDSAAASFPTLKAVRDSLSACYTRAHVQLPGGSAYVRSNPGIHMVVQGSGFYDTQHPHGVGPQGLKTTSAWELHPVTLITCP